MSRPKKCLSSIRTVGAFLNGRACSDTLFHILNNHAFAHPLKSEERAVMPLAGGILQHGYQCGMIWGATLAAGAQAYRLLGPGTRAEAGAIIAGQRLVESFRTLNKYMNCIDITGLDKSSSTMQMMTYFLIKGGSLGCFRMAARYAPVAYSEITSALSGNSIKAPLPPVSCTAMLTQKMGVSDMHTVMAAGFAGGIGLSGGACGALASAIWITGMNSLKGGIGKVDWNNREAAEVIARFVKCTDCEFECSKIVGRKFRDVDDHAAYLRDGGCANIIKTLAAAPGSRHMPNIPA